MRTKFLFLCLCLIAFFLPYRSFAHAAPDDSYEERLKTAELAGDQTQVESICRDWYQSGEYSQGVLNWNYNALMSVENGAILITQSEHDTYPALMLQNALDVRPDITLINFQLIENQAYRSRIVARLNLPVQTAGATPSEFVLNLVDQISRNPQHSSPLYFSVMLDKSRIETDKRNLYITGLALKYSPKIFDNVAVLRSNYERAFRTDYLRLQLLPDRNPELAARLNLNYIPAFLLLHRHYAAAGETAKADAMQELTMKIAKAGNREAETRAFFPSAASDTMVLTSMNPKNLEKPMKKVTEKLYAAETELSNAQYELFLQDLLKNKDFDALMRCKTTKTDWHALLPERARNLPDQVIFAHGHPDDPQCPVQNLSREAAESYCAWITKVYNNNNSKKKFKKVLFRLPTEAEWILAAEAGLHNIVYPWGGQFVQNNKGCYLGNFKVDEPCPDCPLAGAASDGGFFTVKVDTYYPNNFGLYNMSGNVAEMVQEQGRAKGGSWADEPANCNMKAVKTFSAPSPSIGFRVFMEVIEE
ncbi:MAG: SUMF1/EgtB/PvdO family nonheme iron enzyme [Bacteroidota bacterium]